MDPLIDYLLQFGNLNSRQIDLIKSKGVPGEIKKDAYYHEAGMVAREVIFLIEGVMRFSYYNSKGENITKYFIDKSNFVGDINSYYHNLPSTEYIQAITDCRFIIFSKTVMEELSLTIIGWDAIISKITAKAMVAKMNKISPMMTESASERYLKFLTQNPNLANKIPLNYLASYLGITKSSLSRIRREIGSY